MKVLRKGVVACSVMLCAATPYIQAKETVSYRLVFEESLRSVWQTEVDPTVTVSSTTRLKLHDKVSGKELELSRNAQPLGIDGNNMADFCIDSPKEPICREVIISDFSYSGVEGVLLGNRGERLQYVVLAECSKGEKACRFPHVKIGPNPILTLLKKGIRIHTLEEEEHDYIVAGPYSKEQAATRLSTIKKVVPDAFLH